MFKRVILENWHDVVPYICFALVGGTFLIIVIRALLMKKTDVERISRLPLGEDIEKITPSDTLPSKDR
ncbi:MAG: hypothetical protein AAGA96_12485 [Verrucomicrobiota bacterium]